MLKTHKIRLNPTPDQRAYFMRGAGIARFVYNWALAEYKATKERGEKMDWAALKTRFNKIKRTEFPFVSDVTKCAAEQALADLRQAINAYYKSRGQNPKLRFPSPRRRSRAIGGFGLNNDKFSVSDHTARIPRLGDVNMAEALRFEGGIVTGRVKEKAGKWYLAIVVEMNSQPVASPSRSVGIDFGLSRFATLSTGEVRETQAYFRQSERKLRLLQRGLARKKKGSCNRGRWKLRVARLHGRISNQRSDFLHKFTSETVRDFALICIEDLNLKGLCQTRLAKSFSDAGIGEAARQLDYKTEWAGTWLQKVGRFFASTTLCHVCAWKNENLKLSDRVWTCEGCGAIHDRDFNASMNIELEGMRLLAGDGYLGVTPAELAASG
jgi:putative transposase